MKTITWGQAFQHCLHTGSYATFFIIGIIAVIAAIVYGLKRAPTWKETVIAIGIALLFAFLATFMRPSEVAANTSQDNAAKGIYLGY